MCQSDPCNFAFARLAIGLTALKLKARNQSAASYLLDLQSGFPLTTERSGSQGWRTYALELESQLVALKTQRDVDQELLSKLPREASQVVSTSDAPPPKKKSKKNPTKDQHDLEWNQDQTRADWARILSSQYPSSPSLVVAYTSLKGALVTPDADALSYLSRLTDAILRALDTIHLFLFSPQNPGPDSHTLTPEHIDSTRIALTSPLLMYTIRTAFLTLVRTVQDATKSKRTQKRTHAATTEYIDKVLDNLLEGILLPLLRAISPLCSARLAPLIPAPLRKDKTRTKGKGKEKEKGERTTATEPSKRTDVRSDVLGLIGALLEALDTLPSMVRQGSSVVRIITCGIRDRLGLETIRELETLYAVPTPPSGSLQSTCQQPQAMPSEPPLPTPTPTQLSAPPQIQTQSQEQRRSTPESRAKRLERLIGTRADRVRALATRDAGWFLASTLNLCVTPAPSAIPGVPASHTGGLLRDALLDRIGKLVRSMPVAFGFGGPLSDTLGGDRPEEHVNPTDCKFNIDPVCQNMLLAICERALSHLTSP